MSRILLLFTLLIGMALRCVLATAYPFREDEAVYGTWALHFLNEDPLFLTVWPDKPPIFIWLLSASFWLVDADGFIAVEFSVRWLNIGASVLTIPIVAVTARRLWGDRAALWAAIFLTLNPFAIAFAPTGYTDPVLVLFGSAALHCAVSGRGLWAGVWLGLAIMTKQQGLLYVPLVVGMLWSRLGNEDGHEIGGSNFRRDGHHMGRQPHVPSAYRWAKFIGGVALIIAPILYWDSLRWAVAPSPWDLSVRNYGVLTLLPLSEWGNRVRDWLDLLWYFMGSNVGWGGLVGVCAIFFMQRRKGAKGGRRLFGPIWFMCTWCLGFLIIHTITSVQIWDRYLLPLVPIFALLIGVVISKISIKKWSWPSSLLALLLLALLTPESWQAAQGRIPIGGDHGDLAGLHEALAWIQGGQGDEPFIIYHQALGPQFRFYLLEEVRRGQVDLRWYPHVTYLVDNAVKAPHRRKFLLQPDWAPNNRMRIPSTARRVQLNHLVRFGKFTLIELALNTEPCDWCVSREVHQIFQSPLFSHNRSFTPDTDTASSNTAYTETMRRCEKEFSE